MKRNFWRRDWFLALVLALILALGSGTVALHSLERSAYDLGVRLASSEAQQDIAVIAIDDTSIENLGRWPWPRHIHAEMIERLSNAGAEVVALTALLSEPQQDPGLNYIRNLQEFHALSTARLQTRNEAPDETRDGTPDEASREETLEATPNELPDDTPDQATDQTTDEASEKASEEEPAETTDAATIELLNELGVRLSEAELALDTDRRLARSMGDAGNVVLGMQMRPGQPRGRPDGDLPPYVLDQRIPEDNIVTAGQRPVSPVNVVSVTPPIPVLGREADAIGHLVSFPDRDGAIRSEPLVLSHYGDFFPSMALQVAARGLNLTVADIRVVLGDRVELGNLVIDTGPRLQMQNFFYQGAGNQPAFPVDSFYDVYSGRINPEKYEDRIVLIGATAFGLGSSFPTPISGSMDPVQVLAHTVASILNEDFFTTPAWDSAARWTTFLVIALYLALALPRLRAGTGALVSATLLALIVGAELTLMMREGYWISLMLPASLLVVGHVLLTTKRFLLTEEGKERSDKESAESNRMLGLAFQQQGQLDMAFEKFRRAPLGDDLMEPLYNLALDFERKRQFNKAASVYETMAQHDPDYRDIRQRSQRALQAQETMIFGGQGLGGGSGEATLVGEEGFEKPMLGRYQVEKELGRGAMGIVYQGRDPKINRVVAIKTLSLSEEFEADELDEMKERFFREAQAAGRLNHPNIVTVYDAGEEQDLAYIAMEYLTGHDLVGYTKPENLLPVEQVLEMIGKAAEALDYAHQQEVVHRDIKPANIMYDEGSGAIKITDFGIARVSNASRTKTGMVVGTPNYMSPEQVKGKKVDGRSDLFSLGVMTFQMLSGELPFQADNPTNIMYKIATEDAPDIRDVRPALRKSCPWVAIVLQRALEKDPDKRYQQGSQMARDIQVVLRKMVQAEQGGGDDDPSL